MIVDIQERRDLRARRRCTARKANLVIGEVLAREDPVGAGRLVEDGHVRLDPVLIEQPPEHLSRAIGAVGGLAPPILCQRTGALSLGSPAFPNALAPRPVSLRWPATCGAASATLGHERPFRPKTKAEIATPNRRLARPVVHPRTRYQVRSASITARKPADMYLRVG
jgi:hypothetical protein